MLKKSSFFEMKIFAIVLLFAFLPCFVLAFDNGGGQLDSALEKRAIAIFKLVHCLVCAGNSIYESDSEFARDLRSVIRAEIKKGKTDNEVLSYLISIYGDRITYSPRISKKTIVLWVVPLIVILFSLFFLLRPLISRN